MIGWIHILVIDDNELDCRHIDKVLAEDTSYSWIVSHTVDSKEGLHLAGEHHFDCILLDYCLPGDNGLDVLAKLRNTNTEVPVIMLTDYGNETIAVEAMKAGAQDYLTKRELDFPRLKKAILEAMQRRQQELSLLQRANYDHLTGLTSRALFMDRLQRAIVRSNRFSNPFALLYIDLDKFKEINDGFGHKYGDLVLKETAKRMEACAREGDTIARLGGDEFAIILEDLEDDGLNGAKIVVERLKNQIARKPYLIQDKKLDIVLSIGVSIYPTTAHDSDHLLEQADLAMYDAKRTSGFTLSSL